MLLPHWDSDDLEYAMLQCCDPPAMSPPYSRVWAQLGGAVMGLCQLAVLVLIWVLQPRFHLLGNLNYTNNSDFNLQHYFHAH